MPSSILTNSFACLGLSFTPSSRIYSNVIRFLGASGYARQDRISSASGYVLFTGMRSISKLVVGGMNAYRKVYRCFHPKSPHLRDKPYSRKGHPPV